MTPHPTCATCDHWRGPQRGHTMRACKPLRCCTPPDGHCESRHWRQRQERPETEAEAARDALPSGGDNGERDVWGYEEANV